MLWVEFVPRGVAGYALSLGVAHQVVLAFLPGRGLHRFYGTGTQCEFVVGYHQPIIHTNHPSKTTAGFTRTDCRVKRKHRRYGFGVVHITLRAVQTTRKAPEVFVCIYIQPSGTAFQAQLNRLHYPHWFCFVQAKTVSHYIQQFALALWAVDGALGLYPCKAAGTEPLG